MKNKIRITIGLIIFIDNIGAGMIMPLLPTLFMNSHFGLLGSADMATKSFYFGVSYLLFPLAAIFSNPYLGYLSDYKGRKFVITMGMTGFIITNLAVIIAIAIHNLWLFLLSRLFAGVFAGSYAAAGAALMDVCTNEQERTMSIKFIGLISILGFIISPAFSVLVPTKLTNTALAIPFFLVFFLSIINLILIILFFPKIQHNQNKPLVSNSLNSLLTSLVFAFRTPTICGMAIGFFLFQVAYNFYFQIVAANLQQMHNFTISQTGLFFLIMGVCYAIGMYLLHPFFSYYFSTRKVIGISIMLSVLLIGILGIYEMTTTLAPSGHIDFLLWGLNILFFMSIPMASINVYQQLIAADMEKQGLMVGVAGQITSLALILSAVLISFHAHIRQFEILITPFALLIVFILNFTQKTYVLDNHGNSAETDPT